MSEASRAASAGVEDVYPLTPVQEGMLFHTLSAPGSGTYVEQLSYLLDVPESLDAGLLRASCEQVVARHPVLRTAFAWQRRPRPLQLVRRRVELPWAEADWSDGSPEIQGERLSALLAADRERGFDLARAPLLRLTLLRLGRRRYRCVLSYHHLLMDAWSLALVVGEILALHAAGSRGEALELPRPRPYRDYLEWLADRPPGTSAAFWREQLSGVMAPTPLGVDRLPGCPAPGSGRYQRRERWLSEPATAALAACARRCRVTLSSLLQGAWSLLLGHYSGLQEVVFGITVAGRPQALAGSGAMVGLFINTLPLRIDLPREAPVAGWLARILALNLALGEHEHTPLVEAQGASAVPRQLPLFESILVFENAPEGPPPAAGPLVIREAAYLPQSNYPLSLMVLPGPRLALRALHRTERLDGATAARLLGHLEALLADLALAGNRRLGELSPLAAAERHQLLYEWNDTAGPLAHGHRLHEPFELQAGRRPDAAAVATAACTLTYGELDGRANLLARRLQAAGGGAGSLVALHLGRSPEMLVAVLGVLKAGAAYVPLDPGWPRRRSAWILQTLGVAHLIADRDGMQAAAELAALVPGLEHVLSLEPATWRPGTRAWSAAGLAAPPGPAAAPGAPPDDLAYVIFTSGSTGTPKGVMVRHRPAINLLAWINRAFAVGPADRLLFVAALTFDLSVYDIFGALAGGATIRLAAAEELAEPARLLAILHREAITLWDSAPAALQQLTPFFGRTAPAERSHALRWALLSGDWIPVALPGLLREELPAVRVGALGGATEATIWSNCFVVDAVPAGAVSIPYGRPIRNARYHVLDRDLGPCPIGVPGDLHIGGGCLAAGYAGDAAQTAWRFHPDPFGGEPGDRLYRTGDRARHWPDGLIEFLGRLDQQVKIHGFRIELGEVEAALRQAPGVRDCVVLARRERAGDSRLVAYVVPAHGTEPRAPALRAWLRERLPAFMVPAAFVALERLPMSANGKLDRAALPPPEGEPRQGLYTPPRTLEELRLVELWEELLGRPRIGVGDDFFELGGHSLLVVRLLAQIESRFAVALPLAALLGGPTVERMAALIARRTGGSGWSPLVALQAAGTRPPLVCVHPGGGGVFAYVGLCRCLGDDQPCYGLQAPGLEAGQAPLTSVEDMADLYLEALRQALPGGPYHLVGWSFGGLVAYEMAQRVRALGGSVGLLALLDTGVSLGELLTDQELLSEMLAASFPAFPAARLAELGDVDERLACVVQWAEEQELVPPGFDLARARRMFDMHRRNMAAAAAYSPRPFPGRLTLLRSAGSGSGTGDDPTRGWGTLCAGGVEVQLVPGTHQTLLEPPHHRVLAERLRLCMDGLPQPVQAEPEAVRRSRATPRSD
jgi:amino acid adenylation domain-containing protein